MMTDELAGESTHGIKTAGRRTREARDAFNDSQLTAFVTRSPTDDIRTHASSSQGQDGTAPNRVPSLVTDLKQTSVLAACSWQDLNGPCLV